MILIVGATGFLGEFVTARLAPRKPVLLARRTSDTTRLPADLELRRGDLNDAQLPLDGIDTLVYCASMGFGHIPLLLEQLQRSQVRRAVFVSTTSIFTRLPSASRQVRLDAEAAVQSSRLEWTILRPTMIYGTPRDRNIWRLLRYLQRWPVFPLCGDALWQPVHVEDVAQAIVAALDTPSTIGNAYNVPGANALSFGDLVHTAAHALGRRVQLLKVPLTLAVVGARVTHVVREEQIRRLAEDKAFDYSAAGSDFNYTPRTFATGVHEEAALLRRGAERR